MPDRSFWSRQRVLLTGHTGFKGAWLSLWLEKLGATVCGFSLEPSTDPSLFLLLEPFQQATSVIGDIRNCAAVNAVVSDFRPTIVVHMAAQSLVRRSYRLPLETFETNVMGTANVLNALRDKEGVRAALIVTTDKVYRNLEDGHAFVEDDPLGAHDPYSASKAAAELAAVSWARSFLAKSNVVVATARAGNVIGGGDWSEDRVVPDVWRAVRRGEAPVLRYPNATRPWQHVLEPLSGYLRYLEEIAAGGVEATALNFGPLSHDVMTVAELAEAMLPALGAGGGWRQEPNVLHREMTALSLDASRAAATIGWRPRLTCRDAIEWTAQWYGAFDKGLDARTICLQQIARYETLQV
ncbi:MAG TPA: CDP-glucose 4,6-dehydratase [Rhizomicrobium sp.]